MRSVKDALRQLAREHLRFVLRRDLERTPVARVRVERHGGERHHREQEESDDEAKPETHARVTVRIRQRRGETAAVL